MRLSVFSFWKSYMRTNKFLNKETYTPGHTRNATSFMGKRTLESHGEFFLPYLEDGDSNNFHASRSSSH